MVTDVCQDCGEDVDEEGSEDTCDDGDKGGGEDAEDGYEGGFLPDRHMDKQTMVIVEWLSRLQMLEFQHPNSSEPP